METMENKLAIAPKELFERPDVQAKFQSMLGKKAPGFIVSVINAISESDMLQKADRNSILFAAANAAALDLPINPNLGFAYIVPYNKKQSDGSYKQFAQFQMGYKGFIQLAQRSGQFKTINAMDVREGEIKSHNRLTGEFDFEWIEDRKEREKATVIGYVGYFKMINGFEKTLFMSIDELKKHGKKYSQSYKKNYGLWEDNFDAMAVKTVLKLLLSKYAPLSVEMQRAVMSDQAVLNDWEAQSIDYADNEETRIDVEAQNKLKEENRIREFIETAEDLKTLEENCYEYCSNLDDEHELKKLYQLRAEELKEDKKV